MANAIRILLYFYFFNKSYVIFYNPNQKSCLQINKLINTYKIELFLCIFIYLSVRKLLSRENLKVQILEMKKLIVAFSQQTN